MDFLTFLEKYEKQDVSAVKKIVETKTQKETTIISEAFKSDYPSKKEALFNLEHQFTSKATAPAGVDVSYVKKNMDTLKRKIESLTEGDIRIIIHNHEGTKEPSMEYEEEGVLSKKKRGRPSKVQPNVISDESELNGEEVTPEDDKDVIMGEDALIEQLSKLGLSEDELKSATDMAETGQIDETDEGKVATAAKLITKINSLE